MGFTPSDENRGSVLALLAIVLFVFIAVAALAVDLSALERRGQTLQNTADAAALAAAATWDETRDPALTRAKVDDLIRQNGLTGDDIEVDVFTSGNEVRVAITDTEPDVFLGSMVTSGGDLLRDASARLDSCEDTCNTVIELPAPFPPTSVVGSGDGYYPVAVGSRFYAVNHDGDEIACVDRETQSACWSNRLALPYSGPITGPVAHLVVVDTRLFFTAQEEHQLTLFCWQTLTESPCAATPLAPLARADALGEKWQQRGGGVVAVDHRVFVFTDDHRVHCVDTGTMAACSGYAGGKPTGLGAAGFEALDPAAGVSGSNIDRVLDPETGRIYHTLQVRATVDSEVRYRTGVFLDCWDTVADQPCSGFAVGTLHEQAQRQAGRLFLYRTPTGSAIAVCSTGLGDIECRDFDGADRDDLVLAMLDLDTALPSEAQYTNGMGVHVWHPASNRLILTTPRKLSTALCWDFNTASYCGSLYGFANGGETQDYGFVAEGACLFGLGHTSIFWAFTADMTPGCPGATADVWVDKCLCGPEQRWGLVTFNFDIGPASPFAVLNVQVRDEEDNLIYPTGASEWVPMIGRPSDVLDLSEIPLTHDRILLRVYLETDGTDPWDAAEPPALVFGYRTLPYLVE